MRSSSVLLLLLLLLLCLTVPHVFCTLKDSFSDRSKCPSCTWQEADEGATSAQVGAAALCVLCAVLCCAVPLHYKTNIFTVQHSVEV